MEHMIANTSSSFRYHLTMFFCTHSFVKYFGMSLWCSVFKYSVDQKRPVFIIAEALLTVFLVL